MADVWIHHSDCSTLHRSGYILADVFRPLPGAPWMAYCYRPSRATTRLGPLGTRAAAMRAAASATAPRKGFFR